MAETKNHLRINHDLLSGLFYAKVKGGNAELHYERFGDDYLEFTETSVPEDSRNFGIASQMVKEGLAFAREQHLKVKPTCPFVKSYIDDHEEHQELLV